jgi:hypothetical protein
MFIDQGHRALGQVMVLEETVIGLNQHIHDGVADADNVEALFHFSY